MTIAVRPTVLRLFTIAMLSLCGQGMAQNNPTAGGSAAAPDDWLLTKRGPSWWHKTQPSPTPVELKKRSPSPSEQALIDRARTLVANRPAKAFALMDGDAVLYAEYKAPADPEALFFGFSMGKTVTAMAVGQAICSGKLKLDTKASEIVPELIGKALGNATVHDLLRMTSGAAEPNADSTIWSPEQFKEWGRGNLDLEKLVTDDRVTKAARGVFSNYVPGEHFSYKSTDPILLGVMVARTTGLPFSQWVQEQVLNPMGAAHAGLYVQDRQQNGLADSGLRIRLDDWMRFAWWVKSSSKESGCFGDFVRKATSTQIANGSSPATRKTGKLFGGYGYFAWTDNGIAPNTAWASGWGGQRISWHKDSDRMVVVFSNMENWMPEVYEVAKDWGHVSK